ncbi:MAG: PKD domain-containing protein [Candidatus Thermoplasmatota archaeon]|nr:PKD domain-containing protein [Candidatus Thermoplasmatota archaeon]MEC9332829.1 PKD domain-containing protein [Candidatus Thermoplasmatota archaeon]MED6305755.1 PKD domain-containing protein [Candidatus Thermoplasmatota archaeon]
MRKALIIAIMMLVPGCLDTTPEELSGVEIQLPLGSVIEGDSASFAVAGKKPSGAKYLWDFGDGSGGTGEKVQHVFAEEGQYTVVLTVVDGEGRIGVASENIEILHRNEFPIASLYSTYGGEGQSVKVNSLVLFDGGSSSDPDGDVLTFKWDFGDGSTGEGMRPNHFYETVGNFTVTLVVNDDGNLSSTAQTWVLVSMRTFSVTFEEHTVIVPTHAGYTAQEDDTLLTHNYPYNLTNVNYSLEWTEDELGDTEDMPFGTIFPDDFTLAVATNYNVTSTDNGTSGNLDLDFVILNDIPANFILLLGSLQDANQYLFDEGYQNAKGEGPWSTTITCNDAPSVLVLADNDTGNDWFLDVEYSYYTATVTEI